VHGLFVDWLAGTGNGRWFSTRQGAGVRGVVFRFVVLTSQADFLFRHFFRMPRARRGEWVLNSDGEQVFLPRAFSDLSFDELVELGIAPATGGADSVHLAPGLWPRFTARLGRRGSED
jgi:hypothetical protein